MNSLFWGALTLGRLLTIPLARKLAPSRILIGNFVLSVVFLGMILIWPINATVIWIASAGLGLALSSVFPTLLVLGESRMKITGSVTGLFFLGSSLGSTFLPMLLGQIFEYIGSYQIMVTLFGFSAVGLLFLILALIASERVGEKARV
jgi:fucose permease